MTIPTAKSTPKPKQRDCLPPNRFSAPFTTLWKALNSREQIDNLSGLWVQSGRMSMAKGLEALSLCNPARRKVIIPDFICPSVVHAITASKLQPIFVPLDWEHLFYDQSKLDDSKDDSVGYRRLGASLGNHL